MSGNEVKGRVGGILGDDLITRELFKDPEKPSVGNFPLLETASYENSRHWWLWLYWQ